MAGERGGETKLANEERKPAIVRMNEEEIQATLVQDGNHFHDVVEYPEQIQRESVPVAAKEIDPAVSA